MNSVNFKLLQLFSHQLHDCIKFYCKWRLKIFEIDSICKCNDANVCTIRQSDNIMQARLI